jgi:AcrR family transcriptional regulator
MRKLADRIDVSATAIYRHFESKEAVLIEILRTGFERFVTYLARSLDAPTPTDRLLSSGECYARFAVENRAFYRIMFMSSFDDLGFAEIPAQNVNKSRQSFQMLVDRVRDCQSARELGPADPRELAIQIWSAGHGLVGLYLTGLLPDIEDDDAFVALFVRARKTLLEGMRHRKC